MRAALLLLCAGFAFAEEVPSWVREAASTQVPSYPARVNAVVLLAEEQVTVAPDGRRMMRERGAIRILQRSRDKIAAGRSYNAKSGRIREFHGWLLGPDGRSQAFKPEQIVDVALSADDVYNEARAKTLECPSIAVPGSVSAYEIVEEEKTLFTQYSYQFQERAPVLVSRFMLVLPPGWEQRGTVLNHAPLEPAAANGAWTWELRNLPWIEDEDDAPGFHALVPRLGVTFYPPEGNPQGLRALKDWPTTSEWLTGLVDPSAEVTAAIRAKAQELTAGMSSELDKIRAIAAFAQKVNYVSVQMNLTRGGGYTPHPATQVLSKNYGDCKDKATLMKALLQAVGVEAYVAVAHTGDPEFVRPEWPSSWQFNHAIAAIRVSDGVALPSVAAYPRLGRLLFFDPTDAYTPFGDLPEHEQGSRVLVLAGSKGELVTCPRLPAAASLVETAVQARLDAGGALSAGLQRQYHGQSGTFMRYYAARDGKDEVRRMFERGFAGRMGGVTIGSVEPADQAAEHRFQVKVDFQAPHFGQIQSRLLLIKPGSVVPGTAYAFPAKPRKLPVKLRRSLRQDKIAVQLPAGYKVDETPDPIELRSPYGIYTGRYHESAGSLVFEQSLEVSEITAPVAEYEQVRKFFDQVASYQESAVILLRQ